MFKSLAVGLCDLVYPPHCLHCRQYLRNRLPAGNLCAPCQLSILVNLPPMCLKCSRHLKHINESHLCPACHFKEMHFDFAWAACLYHDPLVNLIHQFKYHQKTCLRHDFFEFMRSFIDAYGLDIHQFDLVVPIPLHPTRLRERGYNQAELLASALARHYQLNMETDLLSRRRNTTAQSLLSQKERWTNIHQAFKIKSLNKAKDKRVLIIDDLLTTGATASEASYCLKEAGAKITGVLTLAITPG